MHLIRSGVEGLNPISADAGITNRQSSRSYVTHTKGRPERSTAFKTKTPSLISSRRDILDLLQIVLIPLNCGYQSSLKLILGLPARVQPDHPHRGPSSDEVQDRPDNDEGQTESKTSSTCCRWRLSTLSRMIEGRIDNVPGRENVSLPLFTHHGLDHLTGPIVAG